MELLRENQASQRALTGLNCNLTAVTRGDYYLSVNCPAGVAGRNVMLRGRQRIHIKS